MAAEDIEIRIRLISDMGRDDDVFTGSLQEFIEQFVDTDADKRNDSDLIATEYHVHIKIGGENQTLFL
jgi:hypothetical protein